ncbi:LamG domain-containing protein [Streptomyces sp. WMMB 714]|uniref:LamG domain-containing protein n=1 Tax=Streptomyces sp. WMMB 714 TaxID=1286822 RepID=UPI001112E82F|nr:LamG domain-containing protein [Streptomyces sp. WMMB 714]
MNLSDAELLRLVRAGGERSASALQELEQRHFPAVRTFAAVSAVHMQAAAELAYQAWQGALRQQLDGGADGAVRACVLSSVLRTASAWAQGHQRSVLHPQLAAWVDATGAMMLNGTTPGDPYSLAARAFAALPPHSQTVLWHRTVEGDDSAFTGRLAGAGPGEVPMLLSRATEELYNSYVHALGDAPHEECGRYHRLVLAYADTRAANIATEVAPHLQRCARCSGIVTDLGSVRHDCGALLARALLPWGGLEHATRGTHGDAIYSLMPGVGGTGTAPTAAPPADDWTSEGPAPAPAGDGGTRSGTQPAGRGRHAALAPAQGRRRHAAPAAEGRGHARPSARRRVDLVVRCTALAGVCTVGAVFAFGLVGNDGAGSGPQVKEPALSAKEAPAAIDTPSPARATAKAKSTSRPSTKPPRTSAPAPRPSDPRPSAPSVGSASVAWLFEKADGRNVTSDSSGNGKDGSLFGASRPIPVNGVLPLDGSQFVAAPGPVVDTSSSFSVSVQVRLDRTDLSQTVVSQDSSEASAFMLRYDADEAQWEMRIPRQDSGDAEGAADVAVSRTPVRPGVPTHLTGVYDDAADQVRLYVDGRLAQTVERTDDFASSERFIVGRGLSGNEFFQGLVGAVDDVQAFGRAVSSAEAKALAQKS